ncbi:MAG: phosphopentomutase [Nitrospiraceae bacterium]|nr:phosphopentomutase [Nitrospiraceae bacterium]
MLIVLDGVGAGEAPDSAAYGDAGSDTLGHVARAVGGLRLPTLQRLGLGNIEEIKGVERNPAPLASWGRMRELSAGKDTITGHWEMMGVVNGRPFPTYPHGFPPEVISAFEARIGRKVLGNRPASGTEIIKELGGKHLETGSPIVYTSADSVFQIAAHVDVIAVEELYSMCAAAREMLVHPNNVCRVIARPFKGMNGQFSRISEKRRDFALEPPGETAVDALAGKGIPVISAGKVGEMFSMRGFREKVKFGNNLEGAEKLKSYLSGKEDAFIFANLNDFDTLYGHRRDPAGYARSLEEFDSALAEMLPLLGDDDSLFITADHGCDPAMPGTDHTRELVPLLFYRRGEPGRDLGMRDGFMDIGAAVARLFGLDFPKGRSFFPFS